MNLLAGPGEVSQVAIDREVPAFFFFVDVQQACAVVDRALAGCGTRRKEQGVGKTGLARRPMTSEGDVPDVSNVISRGHGCKSPLESLLIKNDGRFDSIEFDLARRSYGSRDVW